MTTQRTPALDGVRGLAILAVMIFHLIRVEPTGGLATATAIAAGFGWAGVDLFFVLSGFLITGGLLDTRARPGYYLRFYIRRTLRIFPLYYVYCALLAVGLLLYGSAASELVRAAPWYLGYAMNFRVAAAENWGAAIAGTAGFWSLCIEEQFYLTWPMLVRHLSVRTVGHLCLALAVLALLFRVAVVARGHVFAAYVLLPGRMDGLALGAWVAIQVREPGGMARLTRWAPTVLALAGTALFWLVARTGYAGWDHPLMATIGFSCTAVASAALIVIAIGRERGAVHALLTNRALMHFGQRAYGLYVLSWIAELLVPADSYAPTVGASALRFLLTLGMALAIAEVSWRCLEAPAQATRGAVEQRVRMWVMALRATHRGATEQG